MAKEKEFEGASEAEALAAAAQALGLAPEEIDYTLIDEGAEGVFGLGARPARVRVVLPDSDEASGTSETESVVEGEDGASSEDTSPDGGAPPAWRGPAPEKAQKAKEVTADLLRLMEVEATIEVDDQDERIVVTIEDAPENGEVTELFRRARPPLAPSLQFLLNKVVNRFPEGRKHIVIEAPAQARGAERSMGRAADDEFDPDIVAMAELLGERAEKLGKVITVHPMSAGDRRAVHQTLMKSSRRVRTVSSGEGLYRQMHVVADKAGGSGKRSSRRRRRGRGGSSAGPVERE